MSVSLAAGKEILAVADEAIGWLKPRLPKSAHAELFLSRGRERSVEMRKGALESLQETQDEGIGLRVLQDGRMAFAYSAGLGAAGLEHIFRQVLDQLPFIPPDERRAFAPAAANDRTEALAPSMTDGSLFSGPLEKQLPRLAEMEETALRADKRVKQVLRLSYGERWSEVAIVNTLGLRAREEGSHCSTGLAAIADQGGQIQLGGGSSIGRFYEDLDFNLAAREAAFRAASLADSRKPPTGRRAVLFDPWVSGEFLELIAGALSAEQVQRGKSLFKGRLGASVAGASVTLLDDPWRKRGIAAASFDDEGVPTQRKAMIEDGILKEYFYDVHAARKDGRESNGSAGRASYKGTPSPSCSNFYLKPGGVSREKLIADTRDGILVLEVMGMHTADPVSGAFSVGLSGIAIENGALTHGVRGAMLAGSIPEVLERVDAIADDLRFFGRLASPTFRVADLMVA